MMKKPALILAALLLPALAAAQSTPPSLKPPTQPSQAANKAYVDGLVAGKLSDAPADSTYYVRRNAGWTAIPAPTSSQITTSLGFTPANKAGDTLTGTLGLTAGSGSTLSLRSTSSATPNCQPLTGHFIAGGTFTNEWLPDCNITALGDQVVYGSVRGAGSYPGENPKVRVYPDNVTGALVQRVAPGTINDGGLVVNYLVTKGQGLAPADNASGNWAGTGFGVHLLATPEEGGTGKPGAVWAVNVDGRFNSGIGRSLNVLAEWDMNYFNYECGPDHDTTGCFSVSHWHSYNSAVPVGYDTLIRANPFAGIFGTATVSGNTLTAVTFESTLPGNTGPFSQGMSYVWLGPTNFPDGGDTFYRVTSCASQTVCTLEAAPPNGTYGFQFNPPQVLSAIGIDTGGDTRDANNRLIHSNMARDNDYGCSDNAYRCLMVNGRQKVGVDTSGATNMLSAVQMKNGQNVCFDGTNKCFSGDTNAGSQYTKAPPLLFTGSTVAPALLDTSAINVLPGSGAQGVVMNMKADQAIAFSTQAHYLGFDSSISCLTYNMTKTAGGYLFAGCDNGFYIKQNTTITGSLAASGDVAGATATISGAATVGGNMGVTGNVTVSGSYLTPPVKTVAQAQALACNGTVIGARITINDAQGASATSPTWGTRVATLTGGGAGVRAIPAFCDGAEWTVK